MINKPLVTVLMPVYNCEMFVSEAVQSILSQTYDVFELLIIDDCSTDGTLNVVKSFQDGRIKLIQKDKNTGYTNSLNHGLSIAKGKYIARMDGDDISLPDRFQKQVSFLEANADVVVCGSAYSIIGSDKLVQVPQNHDQIKVGLLLESKFGHPTVMLRKSIMETNKIIYNPEMEPVEDYDLWVQLCTVGRLHNLQEYLVKYRIHNSQTSFVRNGKQLELSKNIRLKVLSLVNADLSEKQKVVYLKAIDKFEKITFQEFLVLLQIKEKTTEANKSGIFDKKAFEMYWEQIELKFNGHYFKNRTSYSATIIKEYIIVYKKLSNRLSGLELFKMIIKSLIKYKVG